MLAEVLPGQLLLLIEAMNLAENSCRQENSLNIIICQRILKDCGLIFHKPGKVNFTLQDPLSDFVLFSF